jgi:prenyl protein peptidase
VFGIYSGMVYIKTGSIWPAIVLHSQCNFFGFPSFSNLFDREYTMPDRVFAGVLYIIGVIVFFVFFNTFFDGYSPWFKD